MDIKQMVSEKVQKARAQFKDFKISKEKLANYIDHTILKPDTSFATVKRVASEALDYNFKSVCINPYWVKNVSRMLENSNIETCSVIGFPLGANTTFIKAKETEQAVSDGATEIDMVINIGLLKEKEYDKVIKDIREVVKAANGNTVKVIIETCYLTFEEKIKATELISEAGAHFVKTSTGFGHQGATIEDVALLSFVANGKIKVKAAGGIRSYKDAALMILSGADRIGASRSVDIIKGIK